MALAGGLAGRPGGGGVVTVLRAVLVPLAGFLLALGVLIGGRALTVLAAISAALFGVAAVLTLVGE